MFSPTPKGAGGFSLKMQAVASQWAKRAQSRLLLAGTLAHVQGRRPALRSRRLLSRNRLHFEEKSARKWELGKHCESQTYIFISSLSYFYGPCLHLLGKSFRSQCIVSQSSAPIFPHRALLCGPKCFGASHPWRLFRPAAFPHTPRDRWRNSRVPVKVLHFGGS